MRVLVANKFWYHRGGLERVMFDEIAWLEGAGHTVAHFSAAHPDNEESPWSEYFAPYLEIGADSGLSAGDKARAAARMFANRDAARLFSRLVADFEPDIIHAHGIHRQLSPSILLSAARRGVPVVQTVHDFHHVCPGDVMLRGGAVACEPRRCRRLWYGPAVSNRCVRGSRFASAVSAAETSFQRTRGAYERSVRRFISPSSFLARALVEGGWRIPCDVVPNAVPLSPVGGGGDFVLYAGRLSPEKGVEVFLKAARMAGVRAVVAGEGPLGRDLRTLFPEAVFRGRLDAVTVADLIGQSLACVVPSTCYENAPMSVLEPMAAGVPVVASRIGGIPEIVEDGVNGILLEPGNVEQLAIALVRLKNDPALAAGMGAAARRRIADHFSPEQHLSALLATYDRAMSS